MNNKETPNVGDAKQESVLSAVQEVISSFDYLDRNTLGELVKLPDPANYEDVSKLVCQYGGGLIRTMTQRIVEMSRKVGTSYEECEQAILQGLNAVGV